ncbi:MAG TPA: hypothetical protein ENH92_05900 [Ectothiorhodospiraceae bacterium]|nr:hypothetical protein [Ectothiorhodospiraceae bacterium]
MEEAIIEAAMAAIGSAFGKGASGLSMDQVTGWFHRALQSVAGSSEVNSSLIEQLAEKNLKREIPVLDAEFTRKNLARWFEIPQEEFVNTPPKQLEPEVLIRHLYLEKMFKEWLAEWGYVVSIGEDLEGKESIDFTPDVYGKLNTLHGQFEVCINFVCDNPPSQYRVRALLATLEAYATESGDFKSEFKWGDIYVVATPFQFGRGTSASIRLQSREGKYTVVKLEGDDIYALRCQDSTSRLVQLMDLVEKAKAIGPLSDEVTLGSCLRRVVKTAFKHILIVGLLLTLVLTFFAISVTSLDDPVSVKLRAGTERYLNGYVEYLTKEAKDGTLGSFDMAILHTCILTGIATTRFIYPEGSILLYHYIYGDGSDLELPSSYFRESGYLRKKIEELGPGDHGPIVLRQHEDWRLSLALNPYYLSISDRRIRIYHPRIEFATLDSTKVRTVIPLGKMKLQVYDNLVSAINPTPFFVYSEWKVE